MNKCYVIDKNGYYTVTIYLDKKEGIDYSNCIDVEPVGLILPKWDGKKWFEGFTLNN